MKRNSSQSDDPQVLLARLATTLNVAFTEARLAFERQLGVYQVLATRIEEIKACMPTKAKPARRPRGKPLIEVFAQEEKRLNDRNPDREA